MGRTIPTEYGSVVHLDLRHLGEFPQPSYEHLTALLGSLWVRLYLFVMCPLPLFHWAHRFRFTLYDGLQVKHLNEVILRFAMAERCWGRGWLRTCGGASRGEC